MDIVLRALRLPESATVAPAAGGASASAWKVEADGNQYIVRLSDSAELATARLSAMAAARGAGLPVPDLLRRASTSLGEGVLLSWLPGVPLAQVLLQSPAAARDLGHAMGAMQRRLHEVKAPMNLPAVIIDAGDPFAARRGIPWVPPGGGRLFPPPAPPPTTL